MNMKKCTASAVILSCDRRWSEETVEKIYSKTDAILLVSRERNHGGFRGEGNAALQQ